MVLEKEEKFNIKFIASFLSVLLIVAIISWNMTFSFAADTCGPGGCDSGTCGPSKDKACLDMNILKELLKNNKLDSSKLKIEVKDGKYIVNYDGVASEGIEADKLGETLGLGKDANTIPVNVKVDGKDEKRVISINNLPSDLKGIEVDSKTGNVVYTTATGKVNVGQSGVYLQSGGKDKPSILKGYKVGTEEKDVGVILGSSGEVSISNKGTLNYKGSGTSISVGDNSFQSSDGKQGSLEFKDSASNFVVKSSKVGSKEYGMNVGDDGLYFGDLSKAPAEMKNRKLSLSGSSDSKSLTGDLSGLKKDESITVSNPSTSSGDFSVDKTLQGLKVDAKINVPKGNEVVLVGEGGGKVKVDVKKDSGVTGISSTSSGDDGKKPVLPDTGNVNPPEIGKTNITPGTTPGTTPGGNPDGGGGGGGPGGDSGGGGMGKWLMWALLIGAGILAAMLLMNMGGEDDKKKDDKTEDSGEKYMGKDNATDILNGVGDSEVDKSTEYNPTEPVGVPCICNESGCFECPNGNCYACNKETTAPKIQTTFKTASNSTTSNSTT